jgi:formylglycine-generating enzyme required for sulfatase activity
LADLESAPAADPHREASRAALHSLQREALLANPLLDFDRLLVLKRVPKVEARRVMGDSLGVGSLNAFTSDTIPRQGHFQDELAVLSNLRGEPVLTPLYAPDNGETLIDPVLHFDATRLLFAQNGANEKNWRLWEMRLDGSDRRQLTPDDGEDIGHFDPCYLPDGRIIFASTASYQGLPCVFGGQAMTCLYLLDPATRNIRQLTFEQDSDWCPTPLPNGRVMYLRWEYTDQSHANSRILFHMNPDGTDQRELRGSGSWFPGSFFYAKPIPGEPHQIIGIAGGHHGTPRSGRLMIMDPSRGRRDAEGIVQEIPGRGKTIEPIVRDRLVDGVWPQFLMPAPLSARYHLVAAKLSPDALWGIYLADVFDNLTLIAEIEGAALLWPSPILRRPPPPVIPDRVKLDTDACSVLLADVFAGDGLQGVPRGTVKHLRVVEYYFAKRGMGGLYGTLGADGPWDVKRILGTVPVEADGSAHFTMPANTPVCVQPLDAQGQALQLERSWFVGMPGERVSCIGCHESAQATASGRTTLAATRPPSALQDWFGPARGFSFVREVQPVLDTHCASCHNGSENAAQPSLVGGEALEDWSTQLSGHWGGGGKFTTSYWELQRYVRRPGIEGDRRMFTPMDYHSSTTELGQLLRKGHHGVTLDPEAFERLAAWVDLNAPFYGTWGEIPPFDGGYGRHECQQLEQVTARADALRRRYVPTGPFPDYEKIPDPPARPPAAARTTAPAPHEPAALPPAIVPNQPSPDAPQWVVHSLAGAEADSRRSLDLGGGVSLELGRVPGGSFAMGSTAGHPDESPVTQVPVAPFWIGRFETTNRQFRRFHPDHESRTEDRHGYQFGAVGYDQDQPDQPAVRVSWEEAMRFCQWLSQKSGQRVSLPTEAQWEWACRAGSASAFSFGPLDADYASFANLADRRLRDFAADTSLDNYAAQRPMNQPNRFDDWLPRDDRFDDGGFVTEPVGRYQPNAWGLHDLHGNAAEWTLSAYRPYPWRDDDGRHVIDGASRDTERVVRGGSWRDRPFRATASFRLPYRQYQRVFNVGFRVVCEPGS